jgi:hypothetical protein
MVGTCTSSAEFPEVPKDKRVYLDSILKMIRQKLEEYSARQRIERFSFEALRDDVTREHFLDGLDARIDLAFENVSSGKASHKPLEIAIPRGSLNRGYTEELLKLAGWELKGYGTGSKAGNVYSSDLAFESVSFGKTLIGVPKGNLNHDNFNYPNLCTASLLKMTGLELKGYGAGSKDGKNDLDDLGYGRVDLRGL